MIIKNLMVSGKFACIICFDANGKIKKINGRMNVEKYGIVKPKRKTDIVV